MPNGLAGSQVRDGEIGAGGGGEQSHGPPRCSVTIGRRSFSDSFGNSGHSRHPEIYLELASDDGAIAAEFEIWTLNQGKMQPLTIELSALLPVQFLN